MDGHNRYKLLKRAYQREKRGTYGQEDIHLLNWFLLGDCEYFVGYSKAKKAEARRRYEKVWNCIRDTEKVALMASTAAHKYLCQRLDKYGASADEKSLATQKNLHNLYEEDISDPLKIERGHRRHAIQASWPELSRRPVYQDLVWHS